MVRLGSRGVEKNNGVRGYNFQITSNLWRLTVFISGRRASRKRVVGIIALLSTVGLFAGCSTTKKEPEVEFGYVAASPLLTSNAGSDLGVSSRAEALAGRLYPSVFVIGQRGQLIPNVDFAVAQSLPGQTRQVAYTISKTAKYSDGTEVTCVDFLLAYKAGAMRDLFQSHIPLMEQVEKLECRPNGKQFTVFFKDRLGARWRHLFSPGTVLPAHAIAKKANISLEDLKTRLIENDEQGLQEVARIWRDGFKLDAFDSELQVASGPYRIERVDKEGAVHLVRNEQFVGDETKLSRITVWPDGVNTKEKADAGHIQIADLVGVSNIEWVDRDNPKNPFEVTPVIGDLNEVLVLGNRGVLETKEARQAFAACIDQKAVAVASSHKSGVHVPPMGTRLTTSDDPVNAQTMAISDAHIGVDIPRSEMLRGQTIRIGYRAPDERKRAMVEAIKRSCEPAGVTIHDASAEGQYLQDVMHVVRRGESEEVEGTIDAVLLAIDPMLNYGMSDTTGSNAEALRAAEEYLWDEVPTIPLSPQPRTFVVDRAVGNVVLNSSGSGIGWNMERWQESE